MLEESSGAFNQGRAPARPGAGPRSWLDGGRDCAGGHALAQPATVPKRGQGGPLVRPALFEKGAAGRGTRQAGAVSPLRARIRQHHGLGEPHSALVNSYAL